MNATGCRVQFQKSASILLIAIFRLTGVRGAEGDAPSSRRLEASPGLTGISLACVDPRATGYATFQSHNQKVVQARGEVFLTHIRTRNEAYTAQEWRLSRSTDGGKTFATVYEATHATNPPVLETDGEDIYLARPDFADGNAYLYLFRRADGFRSPRITAIPGGAAGKYAMEIDRARGQLYFFSHNNRFFVLGLDGAVRSSVELLAPGPKAVLQYPLLYLDRGGRLSAAWTTQAHGRYLYWDIHFLSSPDGGKAWRKMDGTPVAPPVVADESGPADRITLDDEFEAHTWLSSFFVRGGKAHFLYLAQTQPPRQHCVRYELGTGRRERDRSPRFGGERISLRSLDGYFAVRADLPGSTIYCIARDADESRIACLASDDDGESWYDYARSDLVANPYSIGGCREIGPDGAILGSFTELIAPTTDPSGGSRVQFFRIQGGIASARGKLQAVQNAEVSVQRPGRAPSRIKLPRVERCVHSRPILGGLSARQGRGDEADRDLRISAPSRHVTRRLIAAERLHAEIADGARFAVGFSEVRGQPSQFRYAEFDGPWSPWQAYREIVEVPGPQPARFQLRSPLGVVSKEHIVEVFGDL